MKYGIRLVSLSDGSKTEVDGHWLKFYNPAAHGGQGEILTTADPARALAFNDAAVALTVWRQSVGTRADGKPNRPLTAFTVSIEPLP